MAYIPPAHPPLTDAEKSEHIKAVVLAEGEFLRQRLPMLKHQNALGAAILAFALAGMTGCGALYLYGYLSAWVVIPLIAVFASLTHELEHDLIHWMYFRQTPWAHHTMMALVWLARPSTINPWIRRKLHFNHHKYSGTEADVEERALTNGQHWGLLRLLMLSDSVFSVLVRVIKSPDAKRRRYVLARALVIYFPLGWLNWATWHVFLIFHAGNGVAALMGASIAWPAYLVHAMHYVDLLTVLLVAPNILRSFCLHLITSNMHYYGDVENGNVIQQTQVLNVWWLAPLQLFCFNFGSTHGIHHFVVKEPFYIRQMTAPVAHAVMREMGVRFNDLGTFRRANRWLEFAEA